jgi:hypothetical protein
MQNPIPRSGRCSRPGRTASRAPRRCRRGAPGGDLAHDGPQAAQPAAPVVQVRSGGKEPFPGQPVGLVPQIMAHPGEVVDQHGALATGQRPLGRPDTSASARSGCGSPRPVISAPAAQFRSGSHGAPVRRPGGTAASCRGSGWSSCLTARHRPVPGRNPETRAYACPARMTAVTICHSGAYPAMVGTRRAFRSRWLWPGGHRQEVPALARRSQALIWDGAAGGADVLCGDEICFADQLPLSLLGDDGVQDVELRGPAAGPDRGRGTGQGGQHHHDQQGQ